LALSENGKITLQLCRALFIEIEHPLQSSNVRKKIIAIKLLAILQGVSDMAYNLDVGVI
jgi:hypothetical protein